jgi:RNA polymerase sigma-70 factor (ECF subfamily)
MRLPGKVSSTPPPFKEVEHAGALDDERSTPVSEAQAAARTPPFEHIYRRYFNDVRRWIRALRGPEADLEDLTQDVFVIAHRRYPEFDGENIAGWLYQITRRRVRDFRELRWFRVFLGRIEVDDSVASQVEGPEARLRTKEALWRLLARLPETQRVAFVLFEIEGYSGEEIAQFHGVSVNTVWARIHKARTKLANDVKRLERTSTGGRL